MSRGAAMSVLQKDVPRGEPLPGRCECGVHRVRPLPGYVCSRCNRFIVGPPKPHRDLSLHQTPQPARSRRGLAGVVGRRRADDVELAHRHLRRQNRRIAEQGRTPPRRVLERDAASANGKLALDALLERSPGYKEAAKKTRAKRG